MQAKYLRLMINSGGAPESRIKMTLYFVICASAMGRRKQNVDLADLLVPAWSLGDNQTTSHMYSANTYSRTL